MLLNNFWAEAVWNMHLDRVIILNTKFLLLDNTNYTCDRLLSVTVMKRFKAIYSGVTENWKCYFEIDFPML